jgi:hypothetical protein
MMITIVVYVVEMANLILPTREHKRVVMSTNNAGMA